jgi:hypothetical protein
MEIYYTAVVLEDNLRGIYDDNVEYRQSVFLKQATRPSAMSLVYRNNIKTHSIFFGGTGK